MADSGNNPQAFANTLAEISEWIFELFGDESLDFSLKEALALQVIGRRKFMRMTDLAGVMHLPVTTATSLVDRLAKRGLLKRSRFEDERRIVAVSLTPEGQEAWARQQARQAAWIQARLDRLSGEERAIFLQLLEKIIAIEN